MLDVAVIGCGIVGAASAYELSKYRLKVAVFERENDVADGTTKANSAIIHTGYDPEPGTLMAKLNVEGAGLAKELCAKLDVPYKQVGSLVLAFGKEELPLLQKLYENGLKNGVPGLRFLEGEEARALEPNLSGEVLRALHAPGAAIVSPWEYALALAETAVRNGVSLHLNCGVTGIKRMEGGYRLTAGGRTFETRCILNAAGVYADEAHNLIAAPTFRILPGRGQYYLLDKSEGSRVGRVIFQCPNRNGKGILVAPTVHGNLIVGPNAEPCGRDSSETTGEGLAYVAEMARRSVPSVSLRESIRNFAGIRANTEIDDFIIGEAVDAPGFIDLAGVKSPGLSAAPAIAKLAVRILGEHGLRLEEKESFTDTRRVVRFKELTTSEKTELIARNPAYGRVVCRCETITEGEILAALASPIPPSTVDGVKRRCNAGMGRCQGGFCGPRVLELLCRARGIAPAKVQQDKDGSFILTGETKTGGVRDV